LFYDEDLSISRDCDLAVLESMEEVNIELEIAFIEVVDKIKS
jgi:hypothetical protein